MGTLIAIDESEYDEEDYTMPDPYWRREPTAPHGVLAELAEGDIRRAKDPAEREQALLDLLHRLGFDDVVNAYDRVHT